MNVKACIELDEQIIETTKNSPPTIVLVEDEDQVRALCAMVLRKAGFSILEAKNGKEAVELVDSITIPIVLLLTDVRMPEMNGKEAADLILQRLPNLSVIFMSGYTSEIQIERGPNFLQKPFTPLGLKETVNSVLANKETSSTS